MADHLSVAVAALEARGLAQMDFSYALGTSPAHIAVPTEVACGAPDCPLPPSKKRFLTRAIVGASATPLADVLTPRGGVTAARDL